MIYGPMTVIVAVVLVACFVIGLAITIRSFGIRKSGRGSGTCPRCRNANPAHARFCANCGKTLENKKM